MTNTFFSSTARERAELTKKINTLYKMDQLISGYYNDWFKGISENNDVKIARANQQVNYMHKKRLSQMTVVNQGIADYQDKVPYEEFIQDTEIRKYREYEIKMILRDLNRINNDYNEQAQKLKNTKPEQKQPYYNELADMGHLIISTHLSFNRFLENYEFDYGREQLLKIPEVAKMYAEQNPKSEKQSTKNVSSLHQTLQNSEHNDSYNPDVQNPKMALLSEQQKVDLTSAENQADTLDVHTQKTH